MCENATMPGHMPPPHAHLWPDTAAVDASGHLLLAGIDAAALAREFGTPLYVCDEATIRAQCQKFRDAFAARWHASASAVAYAGKAYLSPALCRILLEECIELDAVSLGEVGIARVAEYPLANIHLHGNFKPDAELAAALDLGIGRIVVDSLDELARVEALARARAKPAAIWLRLCPDVPTQTHTSIQTGHADSKFGLDVASGAAREAAVRAHESPWLDLVGLHAHAGSHLLDLTPVARVVAFLGAFAADLRETTGTQVRELSPGGGLGVAYLPTDRSPAIADYADVVTRALAETVRRHRLEPPRVVVEPGRAIVARAGVALYTTGPRKAVPGGTNFLAVDGGMGDNPRPALYGAEYWAALAERMTAPPEETVCIVGRYCESGDVLVKRIALPRARPGDVLAMPVSGAYQLPMASNYNLIARPAVVFVRDGQAHLVRRREALEDLLRLEVED
jgi:diaminopimelate decarboxylase